MPPARRGRGRGGSPPRAADRVRTAVWPPAPRAGAVGAGWLARSAGPARRRPGRPRRCATHGSRRPSPRRCRRRRTAGRRPGWRRGHLARQQPPHGGCAAGSGPGRAGPGHGAGGLRVVGAASRVVGAHGEAAGPGLLVGLRAEPGELVAVDHRGRLVACLRGGDRVADVVAERRGDLVGALERDRRVRPGVEHPVADRVEGTGDAGAHLARAHDAAVVAGRLGDARPLGAGPPSRQRGVEQRGEVVHVGLVVAQRRLALGDGLLPAVQHPVDDEADQLDRPGLGDHHVLGDQPAVGDAVGVRGGDRVRDLLDQPRGPARRQRPLEEHLVERDPVAPLVDDVDDAVLLGGVEHAQEVAVGDGGGRAGGGEQPLGPGVRGVDHVHRDAPGQDQVRGPPELGAVGLGDEVLEPEPSGEHGAMPDRLVGHVLLAVPTAAGSRCVGSKLHARGSGQRRSRLVASSMTLVTSGSGAAGRGPGRPPRPRRRP